MALSRPMSGALRKAVGDSRVCDDLMVEQNRPSGSAENVAAARAILTSRGILADVHAERFVSRTRRVAIGTLASLPRGGRALSWIAARTRYFDDLITTSLDSGVQQVVIVAAGYDTRAWRLAREGVRFVEVDHPATQGRKIALSPPDGPDYIAADLAVEPLPNVLTSRVDTTAPAVILCEGLTYYLTEQDVRGLLVGAAATAAEGSRLGVDFATSQPLPTALRPALGVTRLVHRLTREPLRFQIHPDDADDLLATSGWSAEAVLTHADLHARYLQGADLPQPPAVGSFVCGATTQSRVESAT